MLSRSIFRQYDIRGVVARDLTEAGAEAIGRGMAALLEERREPKKVVVGRDNRPSGSGLRDALIRGLRTGGVNVTDIGVVPTPALYWALHHLRVGCGIQITGSHNPPEFNGMKISVGGQSLHGDALQHLFELASRVEAPEADAPAHASARPAGGALVKRGVLDAYVDDLVARIGPVPTFRGRPLQIAVDCGNGAGALVAERFFKRLGVGVTLLFGDSDGTFPNHHPDPTVLENLQDLIATVRRERCDFGIGFDGDADRIGLVDGAGQVVWGDYLLLLYARDVLQRSGQREPIIFDVKCSQALPDAITAAGGTPVMWKTGHSLIKEKMRELGAPVAGEMSGHMFFSEGFLGHDDAIYAAGRLCRIAAGAGRSVTEMLADVPAFVSTPEIRVDCDDARKFEVVTQAVAHFRGQREVVDVDGARVLYGDGWGLVRASNTQPILVLRFEARSRERLHQIRDDFASWLATQGVAVPELAGLG